MKLTKQEEKILRKILSVFLWILAGILVVTAILIKPVIGLVMFGLICYFGGIVLILLAISKKYIGYGRMRENSWICLENNERFVGMKMAAKTLHFKMGDDNVARWEIEPKDGGPELEPLEHIGLTAIGKGKVPTWPITRARWYNIRTNGHEFVHSAREDEPGFYNVLPKTEITRNPGLFYTHSFETAPVITRHPSNGATTTVVGLFQVQFRVFNPYLATYMTPDFMSNVNQTLQAGCRQLTATYDYIAFISAKSEGGGKDLSDNDKTLVKNYGNQLKDLVNASIAQYGIEIDDVDFIDAYLADKRVEREQQDIQIKIFQADARRIESESMALEDKVRAEGYAASLKEKMKVVKDANLTPDQQRLLEAEIHAAAHVQGMEKFRGSVYSHGGPGTSAIVDVRRPEKEEETEKKSQSRAKKPNNA